MKRYSLEQGKGELNSTSGNFLLGLTLKSHKTKAIPQNFKFRRSDAISDRQILLTQIGLICNGRTDFNDVDLYRDDKVFMNSFGLSAVPSEPTFRRRLEEMPEQEATASLRELVLRVLGPRTFGTIDADGLKLVPADLDASPLDNSGSSKEGVGFTYKGHDGFGPMFAYLGTEGYMLDCELRPGTQHCQSGTPEFLRRTIKSLHRLNLDGKCLIRLDSGYDAGDNFDEFGDQYFIVKRNLRRESKEKWLKTARENCVEKIKCEDGRIIYKGFVENLNPGKKGTRECVAVAFEVIERTEGHNGQTLLLPEIEVNSWWTNLTCSVETVIELYHDHATSEQYHSELKSDLGVERLPSGKLRVNKIILHCAMVAFSMLRIIGQQVIERVRLAPQKITVYRWRMKTILQNIIYCAARLVRHSGGESLHFGKQSPWFNVISDIARSYP